MIGAGAECGGGFLGFALELDDGGLDGADDEREGDKEVGEDEAGEGVVQLEGGEAVS